MTGVVVTAAVAPLLAAPALRAEQVSQLVLGEGAEVMAAEGQMLRVRGCVDGYEGWLHAGYAARLPLAEVEAWLAAAHWSEGALVENPNGVVIRAHHRARLLHAGGVQFRLPDGTPAEVVAGDVRPHAAMVADVRRESPAEWAWREFAGTPYLWGGVTAAGIDCSGLVQTAFLARGTALPRDSHDQATFGEVVAPGDQRAGDLCFFRNAGGDRIGHVAIVAGPATIVHSTVELGGVVREAWDEGSRAAGLRERLVAVRRLT